MAIVNKVKSFLPRRNVKDLRKKCNEELAKIKNTVTVEELIFLCKDYSNFMIEIMSITRYQLNSKPLKQTSFIVFNNSVAVKVKFDKTPIYRRQEQQIDKYEQLAQSMKEQLGLK